MLNLAAMGAQRRRGRFLAALRALANGSALWTASATADVVLDLLANRSQILSRIDGLRVNSLWGVNNLLRPTGRRIGAQGEQGFGYLRRQKRHLGPGMADRSLRNRPVAPVSPQTLHRSGRPAFISL